MLMHFYAYIPFFLYILILICVRAFLFVSLSLSLSLSLSFYTLACSMAPKHKSTLSRNPFHSRASPSSSPSDSTPSVMIKPIRTFWRTSHDKVFIWNAKLFYRIFPILAFPLSSTVGVGSYYVASRSLFPP